MTISTGVKYLMVGWINREIRSAIRKRERLYQKYKRSKCQDWLLEYECTKVQNPRRTRVRESLKAHALDL